MDILVTVVDEQVEVLQEVFAEHAAHLAGDGCGMIGAEYFSSGERCSGDGERVDVDDRHFGGGKHADDGLFGHPGKTEFVGQLLVDDGLGGTRVEQEVIRAGAIYADRYNNHGKFVQLDLCRDDIGSWCGLVLRPGPSRGRKLQRLEGRKGG